MASEARCISFDRNKSGVQIVMDTGEDSIFLWYRKESLPWPELDTVGVHIHDDEVDETIVVFSGEGYYLHGKTPDAMVKTPFKAPCLLYLPANEYHPIVNTGETEHESVLMYSPGGCRNDGFADVIARARHDEVRLADLLEQELPAEQAIPHPLR